MPRIIQSHFSIESPRHPPYYRDRLEPEGDVSMRLRCQITLVTFALLGCLRLAFADDPERRATQTTTSEPARRVLLLYQGPDGHPAQTHEYELGMKVLQKLL